MPSEITKHIVEERFRSVWQDHHSERIPDDKAWLALDAAIAPVLAEVERLKEELRLALAPAVAIVCLKPTREELQRDNAALRQQVEELKAECEKLKIADRSVRSSHAKI